MSNRGGREDRSLEEMGCSPETINKIILLGHEKEKSLSRKYLLRTFKSLNAIFPQEEKDRNKGNKAAENDSLSDLAIKVCCLAELLGGMWFAAETRRDATKNCLNEALEPSRNFVSRNETEKGKKKAALEPARDDLQAAIETKFRIKLQEITIASLERQLKELRINVERKEGDTGGV